MNSREFDNAKLAGAHIYTFRDRKINYAANDSRARHKENARPRKSPSSRRNSTICELAYRVPMNLLQ